VAAGDVLAISDRAVASANDGVHVDSQVQFYLNCNGGYATATTPGDSLGWQTGRGAKAAADEAAAATEQPIKAVSTAGG
jgi:hypothetical protein